MLGGLNRLHHVYCNREAWKRHVREELVAPAIEGMELGDVLEIGPGFGPGTEVLAASSNRLTALEIDPSLAAPLRDRLGDRAEIVEGDGAAMPFPDGSFDVVACFTMLHHVPSPDTQDRLFGEVARVLRPGGWFVGTDSVGRGIGFWLLHIGDTKVLLEPRDLPRRLAAVGLRDVQVTTEDEAIRFSARR